MCMCVCVCARVVALDLDHVQCLVLALRGYDQVVQVDQVAHLACCQDNRQTRGQQASLASVSALPPWTLLLSLDLQEKASGVGLR